MGLYFRKSIKLLPGLKLNFGKKSTSVTIGSKVARVTYGKGRTTYSTGIPGTGVYYRKTVSDKNKTSTGTIDTGSDLQKKISYKKTSTKFIDTPQTEVPERTKAENTTWGIVFLIIGIAILSITFISPLQVVGRIIIGGIGALTLLASATYFSAKSSDEPESSSDKNTSAFIKNKFGFAVGLIILLICGYLFLASFGWSWQEHSKHNIYIVYHFAWLKWIFYPLVLIGLGFGALCMYAGLQDDDTEKNS